MDDSSRDKSLQHDATTIEEGQRCPTCGAPLYQEKGRIVLQEGERIAIVENVEALVCDRCSEHFYAEGTMYALDRLRAGGFKPEQAQSEIRVPVYSLEDLRKDGDE